MKFQTHLAPGQVWSTLKGMRVRITTIGPYFIAGRMRMCVFYREINDRADVPIERAAMVHRFNKWYRTQEPSLQ